MFSRYALLAGSASRQSPESEEKRNATKHDGKQGRAVHGASSQSFYYTTFRSFNQSIII